MSGVERARFAEAVAAWRLRGLGGQAMLVSSAVDLIVADAGTPAVAELAGLPASENGFAVDALVERAIGELALAPELAVPYDILAARAICRALLSDARTEREVTSWAHEHFHHQSESELLNELALIDDDLDAYEAGWGAESRDDLGARVREIARLILLDE